MGAFSLNIPYLSVKISFLSNVSISGTPPGTIMTELTFKASIIDVFEEGIHPRCAAKNPSSGMWNTRGATAIRVLDFGVK